MLVPAILTQPTHCWGLHSTLLSHGLAKVLPGTWEEGHFEELAAFLKREAQRGVFEPLPDLGAW